jgi:hypothetical protein
VDSADDEVLLVVNNHAAIDMNNIDVVHAVSPTVMIVRRSAEGCPASPDQRGIAYCGVAPPPEVLDRLNEQERLFVAGWRARRAKHEQARPGDGLAWDAPGMSPPDLPPRPP